MLKFYAQMCVTYLSLSWIITQTRFYSEIWTGVYSELWRLKLKLHLFPFVVEQQIRNRSNNVLDLEL